MNTLKPITADQIRAYSPRTAPADAERLAAHYNATWAGALWRIADGRVVYERA